MRRFSGKALLENRGIHLIFCIIFLCKPFFYDYESIIFIVMCRCFRIKSVSKILSHVIKKRVKKRIYIESSPLLRILSFSYFLLREKKTFEEVSS